MFLAAKVGVTAFKVGKVAVNTKETFGGLQEEIELWKVQHEYYTTYFEEIQPFVPPSLLTLALSRLKVLQAYIERLLAKIEKADAGDKKAKMMIIGKSSGEMGSSFAQDITEMFGNLDECIQFSQVHITCNRIRQLKVIDEQLKALGQPGIAALDQQQYLSPQLEGVVQSRRMIFVLEWPLDKVAVGSKIPISWTVAGDIPYLTIEIQVSSLMQQAQDKNKKNFITVGDQISCQKSGAGHYTWEVPMNFVALHGKHSNYFFKLSYNPKDNKTTSRFTSKVKSATDSFKIYDPSKKVQETKASPSLSSSYSTPSSSYSYSASSSPATSAPSHSSSHSSSHHSSVNEKEKEKEKEKGVMGKASGLVGGFKKKF